MSSDLERGASLPDAMRILDAEGAAVTPSSPAENPPLTFPPGSSYTHYI